MAAATAKSGDSLKWLILFTVIIGTFLGRLDQTIVNLALPKIINDFSISVSAAGWIGTAYMRSSFLSGGSSAIRSAERKCM
jgi:DHA2 family multidrug resistance protein